MNRRVLLIDADTEFRDSLTRELGRYRVVVMTEPDAERALALVAGDPPALIVISVEEPEKAGFRQFQKCKKGALVKVPIVLITSSVTPESFAKHRGLKVHADEYLDKRSMTSDELIGKLDNLIGLGDPQEDDELSIPVEDDIPLEIAEGDVVLDETVGEDHSHEFGNEMRTVGPDDGISVDSVVEAETDAAFAALLGDDDPGPAPGPSKARLASALPVEETYVEPAMSAAEAEAAAIPEPVPHVLDDREPSGGVPALIHDSEHAHDESQVGATMVDPAHGADEPHSDFDDEQPVMQVSSPLIEKPERFESQPAISLDDEELVPMDDDVAEISDRPPPRPHSEPVITSADYPERGAVSNESPTVMRAPIHHESPTVLREPIIPDAARADPRTLPPAKGGSGSHPAIDLGLDMVAQDAQSEQSGIYDRRALRKIGELERQIAQLKAELERARTTADSASKGAGREREFLNLRESMLAKDKELRQIKDEVAARDHELGVAREALRQAQHAKTALETKNSELEQRLFDDSGKTKELVASARTAAAQAATLQQELAAKTAAATAAETARVQLERDLATERANRAATASEAERTLRLEREQLIQRHQTELAAQRAEAQASESAVRAAAAAAHEAGQAETETAHVTSLVQLRQELEGVHAAAVAEAVEEVRRANADEHTAAVAALDKAHAAEMVRIKTDQATELTRIKGDLGGELERVRAALGGELDRVKSALAEAETAHAETMESIAQQYGGQLEVLGEQHATELATREHAHAVARENDAAAHGVALEALKAELDRLAASHDIKLGMARKQLEQVMAEHEQAKLELHHEHEAAVAALGAQHGLEIDKLHDDRDQLGDAARRAAETHRATVGEMQAKFDTELSQLHEAAGRELAEQKAALLAAKRAAEDHAARQQAEHETAAAGHAHATAELEAKHERALALASGEILKIKSVADAEHTRTVAAHEAATEKLRSDLEAEHVKVVKELTGEREELRRGLSSARDSLKRSESELASAVQTIADRNAELRAHASAIAERDQRIADLRKEIEGLESENASYQDQVLRAYQKIKTDEAMVARARKAMAIALTVLDDQGNPTSS